MTRVAHAALVVVAALGLLGAPACSSGSHSSVPSGSVTGSVHWTACDHGFQCATVRAPRDYADPNGPTVALGMVRHPAAKPSERIGPLFVNPGGPGGSAADFVEDLLQDLPAAVTDRFDVIGLDPRGVGRSTPLRCDQHVEAMYRVDPSLDSAADEVAILASSRTFVADCRQAGGALLAHLGTRDVARDMDRVRQLMGDGQLSYLGYSYGTSIGQVYGELFPSRVRAMVLDGIVDLSQSGIEAATDQADGFELALRDFAADCRARSSCPVGADPIGAVDTVQADAERAPIPARGERRAGPGEVALAIADALYDQGSWPDLATALHDGMTGDGRELVHLADDYLDEGGFGDYFAVSCLDSEWPAAATLLADAKAADRTAPHFGAGVVGDYVRCSLWPAKPQPLTPPTGAGLPPTLVVSTTGDPATPYAAGTDLVRRLPGSRLLTHVGEGHTASYQGDTCIDDAVTAYLVRRTLPPAGTRCR